MVIHPLAVLVYVSALSILLMTAWHPFYVAAVGVILVLNLILFQAIEQWKKYFRIGLQMSLVFILVNLLVCHSGNTLIWKIERPPFLGITLDLSVEEIFYNVTMAFQMILLLTCFCLYSVMQDSDRSASFFSQAVPRLSLTLTLIALTLHQLKEHLYEAKHALEARGVNFTRGYLIERLQTRFPLLKIVLLNVLEGSWQTAEALHARHYGSGKRTCFNSLTWGSRDLFVLFSGIGLWIFLGFCWIYGEGKYHFYPLLDPLNQTWHPVAFLLFILTALLAPLAQFRSKP